MATAESTRAGWPACSSAPSIASAFITVASMPIESARARSMPLSAPSSPRKKLPPPTTTATCTPSLAAALRSPARRRMVGACRPWESGPIRASPESLTTTRLNSGCGAFAMTAPPVNRAARRRAILRHKKAAPRAASWIARPSGLFYRFLDAFAERVADESLDRDRTADRPFGLPDRLGDGLGRIMDVRLIEEADLPVEGLEAGFDNLLDDVRGLAGVLLDEHRALALNGRRIDPGGVERDGTCRGDMHRHLPPERAELCPIARGFERDDDSDPAEPVGDRAVHIMADRALGDFEALRAAQRHVFADGGDGVGDRLADRPAAGVMRAERFRRIDVGRLVERHRQRAAHQRLEVVVAGDEVGLGIDFHDNAGLVLDGDPDQAFGRHPSALLGRFRQALLAQPVHCRLDVAAGLAQGVLAIHHARAGLLAQLLDQASGNGRHTVPLSLFETPRAGPIRPPSARAPARSTGRALCGH